MAPLSDLNLQYCERKMIHLNLHSRCSIETCVRKLCREGHLDEALQAVPIMEHQGLAISQETAYSLLQVCIKKKDLAAGKQVESLMIKSGLHLVSLLGDHLIRLFASCGSLPDASKAFWKISEPTVYTWNAIISAHARLEDGNRALELYRKMQQVGMTPDTVTFLCILKACAGVGALLQGRQTHDQAIRHGLDSNAFSNSLVDMYAKCGSLEDACCVFDGLNTRTVVSWGAMMAGYVENGNCLYTFELFERMKENGIEPNRAIYLCILKACISKGDIRQGRLIHYEIIKSGSDLELMVGNTLIDMYAKFSCLEDACRVFDKLPHRDVVSWDVRIAGLTDHGHSFLALELFEKMQQDGLKPDKYTYSCILKACATEGAVWQGKLVHDRIVRCGFESNIVVVNTLIDMYGKCGCVGEACKVFDGLLSRDVVSWGTIIARCVQHGLDHFALKFFEKMQQDGFFPNKAVFVCVLKACITIGTLARGRLIHDQMIRTGLGLDLTIGSTLVDMYGRYGSLEEAGTVFDSMNDRNEVTWGLMIAGYVQHGYCLPAVELFAKMQGEGIKPDKASFLCMLKACGKLGAIVYGRLLHGQIIESGLTVDMEVGSALIDMYAKCGNLEDAYKILYDLPTGNAVLWGAMIAAFARSGHCKTAWECLKIMNRRGLKPDHVIFTNLFSACTNAGLLEEGCQFFTSMIEEYGIEPRIDHYNTIVDLLGRAGQTREAEDFLLSMPSPSDVLGWMSLLSCCRTYGNLELARRCFEHIVQLNPNDASGYVLMSNIYTDADMWENLKFIQDQQVCAGVAKNTSIPCIEVEQCTYEFVMGDTSHFRLPEIHANYKTGRMDAFSRIDTEVKI